MIDKNALVAKSKDLEVLIKARIENLIDDLQRESDTLKRLELIICGYSLWEYHELKILKYMQHEDYLHVLNGPDYSRYCREHRMIEFGDSKCKGGA